MRTINGPLRSGSCAREVEKNVGGGVKKKHLAVSISLFLLLGVSIAPCQTTTTGSVAGTVTDPSGYLLPNAKVTLKDVDKGISQQKETSKDGFYRFDLLPPGNYSLTVASTGFGTAGRRVPINVGQVSTVNFQLKPEVVAQTVDVSDQAPLLEAEDSNLASNITEIQATSIPNPGNDLTYMAQIAPGSVMNTAGGGLGNFSSYGISAVANFFTLNGMDDNDPFLNFNNSGATNLLLGQNEIQEVSVIANGYSGQYGTLAGANVNYVTRSGTNQFHSQLSWYWNGSALNANSWFHNANGTKRSFVNANQYGADVGGPIVKDHLFFYANFEGLYLEIPTSTQVAIPSPAFAAATQANINSSFGPGSQIAQFYQNIFSLYAGAPGANRAANTITGGDCDASLPAGLGFGPNNPCGLSFVSNVGNKTHENLQAYRIDWNATNRDRFYTRIQRDVGLQASITDPINPLFNVQSFQPEWQGQASETHAFSGGTVNQFLAAGQWFNATAGNANQKATLAAFPTTLLFGSGQFSNMGGLDFIFPVGPTVTQFQISDDFTKSVGTHTFKVGAKYHRAWITSHDFSTGSTGMIIPFTQASFYNGGTDGNTLLSQSFATALEQRFAIYYLGGYAEDDWKVKSNLTLTLSLRLDHPSNTICFNNCFARPAAEFPRLSTDPTTPYNQLLLVNQRQMLPSLTSIEVQPRFGFAWQPGFWGVHKTVVRGGIGIFYDAFRGALLDNMSENPPLDPTFTVFGSPNAILSSPADPSSLFASASASNAAFQQGFKNGDSFSTILSSVPGFSAPNLAGTQNNPKVPQYQKWSLELQRQFGENSSVSLQYVGNHGIHIYTQNSGINGCNVTGTFSGLPPCNSTTNVGINPNFLAVNYAESIGVSNYNGLTASFTHRYKGGILQLNYSYSHALDTVSNSGIPGDAFSNTGFSAANNSIVYPQNPANPRANYASADYDTRHNLTANYVWELPIKRFVTHGHGPDRLLQGWNVNGTVFVRTGFPYTLVDNATSGALEAGGYGSGANVVEVFGSQLAPGGTGANCAALFPGTPQPSRNICLNGADFTISPNGFGNVGRNTIRGPSYWNTDFSLLKHTHISEGTEFVFGAQFFNLFNHPNFDAPVMDVSNPRFGQVIRTVGEATTLFGSGLGADASPRLIQLKLQFVF